MTLDEFNDRLAELTSEATCYIPVSQIIGTLVCTGWLLLNKTHDAYGDNKQDDEQ